MGAAASTAAISVLRRERTASRIASAAGSSEVRHTSSPNLAMLGVRLAPACGPLVRVEWVRSGCPAPIEGVNQVRSASKQEGETTTKIALRSAVLSDAWTSSPTRQ